MLTFPVPIQAAIPYTTFPTIDLGVLELRTFGVMVAVGVVAGATIAARHGESFGVPGDQTISLATRMVVAGVIGARLTWVLTNLESIEAPIDIIAVWEGGLQFSGGFIAAVLVGLPRIRRWGRLTRWRMLDGMALGLAVGIAIGRIGCYSVGEHLGGTTTFALASRYDGGDTREGFGADGPRLEVGDVIHNTSLYELAHLGLLSVVLTLLIYKRRAAPATAVGLFLVWYSIGRFTTDFFRAYDTTVLGLTGAQLMSAAILPFGLWGLLRKRPRLARQSASSEAPLTDSAGESCADRA